MKWFPIKSATAKNSLPMLRQLEELARKRESLTFADLPTLVRLMQTLGMRKIEIHQSALQGMIGVLQSSAIAVGWVIAWFVGVIVVMIAVAIVIGTPVYFIWGDVGIDWLGSVLASVILIATCLLPLPGVVDLYSRLRVGDPFGERAHVIFWAILVTCMGIAFGVVVSLNSSFGQTFDWTDDWVDLLLIPPIGMLFVNFVSQVLSRYHALCPAANNCRCHEVMYCQGLCGHTVGRIQQLTTGVELAGAAGICGRCLLRVTPHEDQAINLTYYQCRGCGEIFGSGGFLDQRKLLVAVLDRHATAAEQVIRGHVCVNVLRNQRLFDLDRVLVSDASEEDVERYVILLQNDADELRLARYARTKCIVDASCSLSGHAMSILRNVFGTVEIRVPKPVT